MGFSYFRFFDFFFARQRITLIPPPSASICRLWGGLWNHVSKIKDMFFETTREIPSNFWRFIRHLIFKANDANSALQLALSYLKKRGETEVEEETEPMRFRSYLGNLARSVLENAEELRENRSTRRKQSLYVVVDLINNEGLPNFKGQRSKENTLKGSKSKIKAGEVSEGDFLTAGVA